MNTEAHFCKHLMLNLILFILKIFSYRILHNNWFGLSMKICLSIQFNDLKNINLFLNNNP